MWDVYLLEEDPFLVFFLALVMIINAREDITASGQEKSDILGKFICGFLISLKKMGKKNLLNNHTEPTRITLKIQLFILNRSKKKSKTLENRE